MSVEVSVLIVSYNTRDLTLACLRSVFRHASTERYQVIVVDNASSDGSAEAIEREFGDRIRLVCCRKNLGFAAANNLAGQYACGEYLLLLNPDTEIFADSLDALLRFAKVRPEAGIWGGRTVFPNGELNIASCWNRPTILSVTWQAIGLNVLLSNSELFNRESIGGWKRDRPRSVDIIVGCFLLITRSLWNQLGGFDLRFWMYAEEADLCLRARELGFRPAITPAATIMHLKGASTSSQPQRMVTVMKGKVTLLRRHWGPIWSNYARGCLLAWVASRLLVCRAVAALRGGRQVANAATWEQLWKERREWTRGYPLDTAQPSIAFTRDIPPEQVIECEAGQAFKAGEEK